MCRALSSTRSGMSSSNCPNNATLWKIPKTISCQLPNSRIHAKCLCSFYHQVENSSSPSSCIWAGAVICFGPCGATEGGASASSNFQEVECTPTESPAERAQSVWEEETREEPQQPIPHVKAAKPQLANQHPGEPEKHTKVRIGKCPLL